MPYLQKNTSHTDCLQVAPIYALPRHISVIDVTTNMSTRANYNSTLAYTLNTKCTIVALEDAKKAIAIHKTSKGTSVDILDNPLNAYSVTRNFIKKDY